MPRPKTQTDDALLEAAHQMIRERGPDALTFASMSAICGLSPSTLVQRFKSKSGLMRNALMHAWDQLDARTMELSEASPRTPAGAIAILVGLSGDYGDIDTYADGLLVLREDEVGFATVANHAFAGAGWRVRRRLPSRVRPALDAARRLG